MCVGVACDIRDWDSLSTSSSSRQFSMFTSSLSAWGTLMEESQGGNGVLSLQVTTAAWFNGTVCQKAEQQSVNQQGEVTRTLASTYTDSQKRRKKKQSKKTKKTKQTNPKPHNGDGLSKLPLLLALSVSLSLLNTRTQAVAHAGTQGKRRKKSKS